MPSKEKYFTALVFTSFVFLIGIIIGSHVTSSRIEELQANLQEDLLITQGFELELAVLQKNNESLCDYIKVRMPEIAKEKVELGRKFDVGDIPESRANILEEQFVISATNFWLFSEIQEEQCGIKQPKILFFADNSELSRQQGKVLDFLVFKTNESLLVFTFNIELFDKPLFKVLKNIYNVEGLPAIIINDKKYEGLVSRDELTEILCSSYDLSIC
jgi:hypothetical protein